MKIYFFNRLRAFRQFKYEDNYFLPPLPPPLRNSIIEFNIFGSLVLHFDDFLEDFGAQGAIFLRHTSLPSVGGGWWEREFDDKAPKHENT